MSYVLGVDPSLTATGLAWIGPPDPIDVVVGVQTLRSAGHLKDTLDQRGTRMDTLTEAFAHTLDYLGAIELAIIEGPSHGSVGGSAWDRAGLWHFYARELRVRRIPIAICAPATRIKWATGSGKATKSTKTDVGVALVRLWPDVAAEGDNEWDALALATIGAQHLRWPVPILARHEPAQTAIVWPPLAPAVDLEESA